jgi:hypothetical protein
MPALGERELAAVAPGDLADWAQGIIDRGAPVTANQSLKILPLISNCGECRGTPAHPRVIWKTGALTTIRNLRMMAVGVEFIEATLFTRLLPEYLTMTSTRNSSSTSPTIPRQEMSSQAPGGSERFGGAIPDAGEEKRQRAKHPRSRRR